MSERCRIAEACYLTGLEPRTMQNLAAGGKGEVRPLTDKDQWIARQVGPELKKRGLYFVGLDVIGEHLTEINVTSPTCLREIEAVTGEPLAARFIAVLEKTLASRIGKP